MAVERAILVVSNLRGLNTGRGGHLYTVVDFHRAMSSRIAMEVVCVGHDIPPPLRSLSPTLIHVDGMAGVFSAARKLRRIADGAIVLHAFDATAVLVARMAGRSPVIFTKCGGAVTRRYTPTRHPDVVFHEEDYRFYATKGAPLEGRFFKMIPNRVQPANRPVDGRGQLPVCDCLVMRVARICEKYEESILQGIRLAKFLAAEGLDVRFACIGFPEDQSVVARVATELEGIGNLLTDDKDTVNASRHLVHADVVVASGRGAMESALLGKVTFVPEKGMQMPALLDRKTIREGLFHNFSDRCRFEEKASQAEVLRILTDPEAKGDYQKELGGIAAECFDLRPKVEEYLSMYHGAVRAGSVFSRLDIARQLFEFFFFGIVRSMRRKFA